MTSNRWAVLSVLFVARTAIAFQFQSIASVSPLLVTELGLDFGMLGALIGAWMLPGVLLALPAGFIGRAFGDKPAVLASLALMTAGSALTAVADAYGLAMTGRVISGIGAVILNVLLTKMVADWFSGRELATAMAILVTSWPVGIGVALVSLGPLSVEQGWRFAMDLTAAVCAIALVIVGVVYRMPAHHPSAAPATRPQWRLGRRESELVSIAALVWAFYNVGFIVLVSFAPVLLTEGGYNSSSAAIVSSFAMWPLVASVPLGGLLADRTGRGFGIMIASMVAMAATMPLILATESPLIMLALVGLLTGPAAGIIMALPARALAAESRHFGMGLFYSIFYLAMAVLPGVAGWLRDRTGIDTAPLLFSSGVLVAAIGCAFVFRWRAGGAAAA